MLKLLCCNLFMIKISSLREKNNNRETLVRHVSLQNLSAIAKYRILKRLKELKKSEITSLRKICHWGADFQKQLFTNVFKK